MKVPLADLFSKTLSSIKTRDKRTSDAQDTTSFIIQNNRKRLMNMHDQSKNNRIMLQIAAGQKVSKCEVGIPEIGQEEEEYIKRGAFMANYGVSPQKFHNVRNENSWNNTSLWSTKSCKLLNNDSIINHNEANLARTLIKQSIRSNSSELNPISIMKRSTLSSSIDNLKPQPIQKSTSKDIFTIKKPAKDTIQSNYSCHSNQSIASGQFGSEKHARIVSDLLKEQANSKMIPLASPKSSKFFKEKMVYDEIEKNLSIHLPYGKIYPYDFASIHKRNQLADIYQRSGVVKEVFEMKMKDRYSRFKVPAINYLKKPMEAETKKYGSRKRFQLSNLAEINNHESVFKDLSAHDEMKKHSVKDGTSNTMNKLKYEKLYKQIQSFS